MVSVCVLMNVLMKQTSTLMYQMLCYVLVVLMITTVSGDLLTDYTICDTVETTILSLDISDCTSTPCPLYRGRNTSLVINFTAPHDITSGVTYVYEDTTEREIPFPIPSPTVCDCMPCPTLAGTNVTYSNTFYVDDSYDKSVFTLKWKIDDQDRMEIVCLLIPAEII